MSVRGAVVDAVVQAQERWSCGVDPSLNLWTFLHDIRRIAACRATFLAMHDSSQLWSVESATAVVRWTDAWSTLPLNGSGPWNLGLLEPSVNAGDLTDELKPALHWLNVFIKTLQEKEEYRLDQEVAERHEAEMLQLVLDGTGEGMWMYDLKQKKRTVSETWAQHLGWTREELEAGGFPSNLIHPDDYPYVEKTMRDHFDGRTSKCEVDCRLRRKDGSYAMIRLRGRVVKWDEAGRPVLMVGTTMDVSSYHKMQSDLMDAQKGLIESAKFSALGVMASGIAHEINNPLAIIQAYGEMLSDYSKVDEIKIRKCHQAIQRSVDRISKIVRGLRKVSRDADGDPFEDAPLRGILDELLSFSQERILQKRISLKIDCEESFALHCQPVQISQVILNLLNNAIDALDGCEERWISIEAKKVGTLAMIYVSDSGPGIPGDLRNQIFQPFFTTKPAGKGTGLGLSISQSIVQEHGGRFFLRDEVKPTCFVIELPIAQRQTSPKGAQTA